MARMFFSAAATVVAALSLCFATGLYAEEVDARATWSLPSTAEVKALLDAHINQLGVDETAKSKVQLLWLDEAEVLDGSALLERLSLSLAALDPAAAEVVRVTEMSPQFPLPRPAILDDSSQPPLASSAAARCTRLQPAASDSPPQPHHWASRRYE